MDCKGLTSIKKITMPATSLSKSCYYSMFENCTSLTTIPVNLLSRYVTLRENCYRRMFYGCKNLIEGLKLSGYALYSSCCYEMFAYCSSLKKIYPIQISSSSSYCCAYMFQFCRSLEEIPQNLLIGSSVGQNHCYAMF